MTHVLSLRKTWQFSDSTDLSQLQDCQVNQLDPFWTWTKLINRWRKAGDIIWHKTTSSCSDRTAGWTFTPGPRQQLKSCNITDIVWSWVAAMGRGQWEEWESTSCWWSSCENGSVTENRSLRCRSFPEQSLPRGLGGRGGGAAGEADWNPLSLVHSSLKVFFFKYWFYSVVRSFIAEWAAELNPALTSSSTCTERLLCSSSVNGLTAVWVFVCVWTASSDEHEPRPRKHSAASPCRR